jgi:hypothetical protein
LQAKFPKTARWQEYFPALQGAFRAAAIFYAKRWLVRCPRTHLTHSSAGKARSSSLGWLCVNTSAGDTSALAQAAPLNEFYTGFLNLYVNYNRPSAPAEVRIDARGRKRRLDKLWRTSLEMLLALDRPQ